MRGADAARVLKSVDDKAKMKQFFRGARLAREHYPEWLQLVTNPNVGEDHCLAFFRGQPQLVLALWLSDHRLVFSLDPAKGFIDAFAETYPGSGTIHLDRDQFDDELTTEVGLMWLRLNRPYTGIRENEIATVLRFEESLASKHADTKQKIYPPSDVFMSKVTTGKMLIWFCKELSVPINLSRFGPTLDYEAFLERSAVALAMEKKHEMDYIDIMRDLFPFSIPDIVCAFRLMSICPQDFNLDDITDPATRLVVSELLHTSRTNESDICHLRVLEEFQRYYTEFIGQSIFAGPLANRMPASRQQVSAYFPQSPVVIMDLDIAKTHVGT